MNTILSAVLIVISLFALTDAQWGYYYPYSYGYWYKRSSSIVESFDKNSVHCRYMGKESVISCRGPNSIVECPVVLNMTSILPRKFELFGLSKSSSMNCSSIEVVDREFCLIPRSLDNTKWVSHNIVVDKREVEIKMCSKSRGCDGIRVVEDECYRDLTDLFCTIVYKVVVPIEGNSKDTCELFGDISMI